MLFREIIAVYSENLQKPINTLCGQNAELLIVKVGMVLSRNLPGGTKENHVEAQDSLSPGQDLNPGPPEYKSEVITTWQLYIWYT
jgi:hypothetical protein